MRNGYAKWFVAVVVGAIVAAVLKVTLDLTMADATISVGGMTHGIPVVFGWLGSVHSILRSVVDMVYGWLIAMLWVRWIGFPWPQEQARQDQ